MKVLVDFIEQKYFLLNISSIPLYEKTKNIILADKDMGGRNFITKLKLNTFEYPFNNLDIKTKNIFFINKINSLYSMHGRKIFLEMNISPSEMAEINAINPFRVICSVEIDNELGRLLTNFYSEIAKKECDIVNLIKNLIERSIFLQWHKLTVVKEYLLLGTGEVIKRIANGENVKFNIQEKIFFPEEKYTDGMMNSVNEYLEEFYSFLEEFNRNREKYEELGNSEKYNKLKEKYDKLKEEIKNDYSKSFSSGFINTDLTAINSFIREGIYLGIALKSTLNEYNRTPFSNTYRSQLSYISKFKRMISSDFIKDAISNINDENTKRRMGDLFSKYNECKFFFDSYKDDIISFTDVEDFAFYFQRLSSVNLNLSERVITVNTEQFKKIFNITDNSWFIVSNQPEYNLWCIPYQQTDKTEIVLMLNKATGEPYRIMRTDAMDFMMECQNGNPYILESIIPVAR